MRSISNHQPRTFKYLLWLLVAFFISIISLGCSKKDSSIESLKAKDIAISAENLCGFSGQGDLPTVKLLLDAGVDVNAKNSRGSNALIEASWAGKQEVVSYLLDNKADVNPASSGQFSALSAAIGQRQEPVALLLLERGANPNIVDPAGSTPLIEAVWAGNLSLVKALLAKGANTNFKRPDNAYTALKLAVAHNKLELVQVLKASGAVE